MHTCACGEPATANGRECGACFRARLGSVGVRTPQNVDVEAVSISEYRRRGRDVTANKRWNRRLDRYRQARADGIQPRSTRLGDIQAAEAISDRQQEAFSARSALA